MKANSNMYDDIVMKLTKLAEGNETYAASAGFAATSTATGA